MEEGEFLSFQGDDNGELDISEDFVSSPNHKAAGTTTIDFDGLLTPPLHLREDLKNGCGGQLWPAGMVLASYLLRKSSDSYRDLDILEIGAGGGLVGLALALKIQHGSSLQHAQPRIHITDQLPMYQLMQDNIALNALTDSLVKASIFDWGTPIAELGIEQPDILLAADCVYFEPVFPLLLQSMSELIGPKTVCYFCQKKRRKADMRFMKEARKKFDVKDVEDDPSRLSWSREGLFLYKITKRVA